MNDINIYKQEFSIAMEIVGTGIDSHTELENIIDNIRDGVYKKEVEEIQSILNNNLLTNRQKEDATGEIKRKKLGLFYPCVYLPTSKTLDDNDYYESTGIIQFDVDKISLDTALEIKEKIMTYDDCLYAFISPRNGLKFGVMTDFKANDKKEFKIAYEFVNKKVITKRIDIKYDESMTRIGQGCLMSYDNEAYFNENIKELIIADTVRKQIVGDNTSQVEDNKLKEYNNLNNTFKDVDSEQVIKALGYIDKNLGYTDRFKVNMAVIDALGVGAKYVLIEHWGKKEKKELEKQIDGQIKGFRKGKISVGTLFKMAGGRNKDGKHFEFSHKLKVVETEDKPTFDVDRLPIDEANEKLRQSIHTFFENGEDKIVNFEAGAGKTKGVLKVLYDEVITGNMGKRVSLFVRSHATADEYLTEFNRLANEKEVVDFRSKIDGMMDRNKVRFKVQHIKGRYQIVDGAVTASSFCEHEILLKDEQLFAKYQSKLCGMCDLKNTCGYVEQFGNDSGGFKHQVRIYAHNELFNMTGLWDGGSFYNEGDVLEVVEHKYEAHFNIIDEDILGHFFDSNKVEENTHGRSSRAIKSVIEDIETGKTVTDAIDNNREIIVQDYEIQKQLMADNDEKLKELNWTASYKDFSSGVNRLELDEVKYSKLLVAMNKFLKFGVLKGLKHTGIRYEHEKGLGDSLNYYDVKKIRGRFKDVPMLILDASADKSLWNMAQEKLIV